MIVVLTGCAGTNLPGSVVGGECRAFDKSLAPKYAVRGKTRYDQDWIDPIVETGVAGCNWPRPVKRPPELDARRTAPVAQAKPQKRKGFIRRTLNRIREPAQAPANVESPVTSSVPLVPTNPPIAIDLAPTRPAKNVEPVDDLLQTGPNTSPVTNKPKRKCWHIIGC